jgi:hypothetical protein
VQGSSGSQHDYVQQDEAATTQVPDNEVDERNSSSSLSSLPLIKSAEIARTARQIEVTSHLKAVRKVSNLRKTASCQAMCQPTEDPLPLATTIIDPVSDINLISLAEAQQRHASKMRAVKLASAQNLEESTVPLPHQAVKRELKVSNFFILILSDNV